MKKIFITIGITILCFVSKAQSPYYYYYSGEKQYLALDTKHAFLSLKEQSDSIAFEQVGFTRKRFKSDGSSRKSIKQKQGKNRYWTEIEFDNILSNEQYLQKLDSIKLINNSIAIVSPYFKMGNTDKIGLSNFFYVKLKTESDTVLLGQMAKQEKCTIVEQDQFMPLWFVLSTTDSSEFNAMENSNIFYESGYFAAAEPNLMPDKILAVNDTYYSQQWGLSNTGQSGGTNGIDIKAVNAWTISKGNNIKVAVVDEGIDLTHPDLAGNMYSQSYDTQNRTSPSVIRGAHGTACAGIIGAIQNNGQGISGVAPNCTLMSISRFLGDGSVSETNIQPDLAAGINWAWQNGADIISNSWGHNALQGSYITDAINSAVTQGRNGKGCVVVFSSGNYNASSVSYPASLSNVIAVGAMAQCGTRKRSSSNSSEVNQGVSPDPLGVSCDGEKWWGSNYGTMLDVVAPGVKIYTTDIQGSAGNNTSNGTAGDYYASFNGTSAACPHVAGVAALILSVRPDLTQAQVRQAIVSTCTKLSGYSFSTSSSHPNGTWNTEVGHGLVNAYAAVNSVTPKITGPSSVCSGNATFSVSNPPTGYTWGYSSSLTLVSTSGNTATFSKSGSGSANAYVRIVVGGTIVATKSFLMGGAPDICNDKLAESDCANSMSVKIGYENGYYYGHITNSSSLASSAGIDQFEWRSAVSNNFTFEPYPVIGYVTVPGDKVRIILNSGNYGAIEIRAHNACGWSSWQWGAAISSAGSSTYSMTASPNPVGTTLNINITPNEEVLQSQAASSAKRKYVANPVYEIKLFTNTGSLVRQTTSQTEVISLDVSNLSNGLYILHVHDGTDNPPQTQNIVISH